MSDQGQGAGKRRRRRQSRKRVDLWRPVPDMPAVEPIRPAADPTIMLRSLGDPPLHSNTSLQDLARVAQRASILASALAASANLLAAADDE